jgi:hypothetical protein
LPEFVDTLTVDSSVKIIWAAELLALLGHGDSIFWQARWHIGLKRSPDDLEIPA